MSNRSRDRRYRIWRIRVIKRDKKCVLCKSRKRRNAHHLDCWKYHKEKRYDVDNGVCLCSKCHSMFHNKFMGGYRKKATAKDFNKFRRIAFYFLKKQI